MENIVQPTPDFDFNQINLESPSPLQGGSFFTKINFSDKLKPLYLQLPKCKSKQGIIKNTTSKKQYCDLMFNSYEQDLLTWFENLEIRCRELIYNKKDLWFQTEIDSHDIEELFNSPIKYYKSGKFLIVRAGIPNHKHIRKDYCLVYDENERLLTLDDINEINEMIPLVHIDGIKFSSKSFQIEIHLPQVMVMKSPEEIKTKCIINSSREKSSSIIEEPLESIENNLQNKKDLSLEETQEKETQEKETIEKEELKKNKGDLGNNETPQENNIQKLESADLDKIITQTDSLEEADILNMKEMDISLDDNNESITLKDPSEVYYEIYKTARSRAKHMRQAAVEAYLEAKNIKTKYMLDDCESDDMSNFDDIEDEFN